MPPLFLIMLFNSLRLIYKSLQNKTKKEMTWRAIRQKYILSTNKNISSQPNIKYSSTHDDYGVNLLLKEGILYL